MVDSEIEVELDLPPLRYKIALEDPKKADKAIQKLKSFIRDNDPKLLAAATEAIETRQKNSSKLSGDQSIAVRLPGQFYSSDFSLAESMAVLMYFAEKPMNTRRMTDLINREVPGKKKDLRNISKQLTSKGRSLYGHTVYDPATQTYALNEYGKRWVETELLTPKAKAKQDGDVTRGE